MLSAEEAQAIVLRTDDAGAARARGDRLVIQSCVLSPRGDHWILAANSEDYVVNGRLEKAYVGAPIYLVSTTTGELTRIYAPQTWDRYLDEKYDIEAHGDLPSLLRPRCAPGDKAAVLALRQKLGCSLADAHLLLGERCRAWLHGKRRALEEAQRRFREQGIETELVPLGDAAAPEGVVDLDADTSFRDEVPAWIAKILARARSAPR